MNLSQPEPSDQRAPLLSLDVAQHRYGNTVALSECQLEVRPGEIHGLVGENGSGKSTIVKILSGIVQPTAGSTTIQGKKIRLSNPSMAQAHGIVTVFQETLIAEGNSSLENIFLGSDGMFRRGNSHSAEVEKARTLLAQLGVDDGILKKSIHSLSIAHRQVLTILRALIRPWKLLILDEATSALDIETRDRLFDLLKTMRTEGRSVLFVSHRMDELKILIDRATVQRSGVTVAVLDKESATPEKLVSLMSGRDDEERHETNYHSEDSSLESNEILMGCKSVSLFKGSENFDLDVRSGEILGVAALEGQGGSTLLESLVGVHKISSGKVSVQDGRKSGLSKAITSLREAYRGGVAYVPAKRQEEGLFPPLTVRDNLIIATISRVARFGFFRHRKVDRVVNKFMNELSVWPNDVNYPISGLSGGNAQKVLISRWLAAEPKVLVLNDPLRGVDIGTKRQFYRLLRDLTGEGVAIVMLSTEIEELLLISDRIAVCRRSTVSQVLSGDDRTHDSVLAAMFGVAADKVRSQSRGADKE